jgi:hypothetical protein
VTPAPLDSLTVAAWRAAPDERLVLALLRRPLNPAFLSWAERTRPDLVVFADFLVFRALR